VGEDGDEDGGGTGLCGNCRCHRMGEIHSFLKRDNRSLEPRLS